MNQGKLDIIKQEIISMNINILGTGEVKWMGKGEFNLEDNLSTTVGKNPLEKNGVTISQQKSLKCSTWMQSQKWQNDLCLFPRQTIQYHSNPSLYPDQ